jgi:hypothetical protein
MSYSSQGKQYQPFAEEQLDNKEQRNTNLQVEIAESTQVTKISKLKDSMKEIVFDKISYSTKDCFSSGTYRIIKPKH